MINDDRGIQPTILHSCLLISQDVSEMFNVSTRSRPGDNKSCKTRRAVSRGGINHGRINDRESLIPFHHVEFD